jgi:hypothetical protein
MPTKDNSHIHNFKGPRATITKKTIHPPLQTPSPRPDSLQPITEFAIGRPTSPIVVSNKINASLFKQCLIHHPFQKPSRSIVLYDANSKGVDHDLPPPIGERPPQSGLAIFWDRIAMTLRLRVRQPKLRKISVSSVAAK